jgi:hypothetical protein
MEKIVAGNTCVLSLSFTDETGAEVTPSAAAYTVEDVGSGEVLKASTAFTPSAGSYDLEISYLYNAIINPLLIKEIRRVTVNFTYGLSNKKGVSVYLYALINPVMESD